MTGLDWIFLVVLTASLLLGLWRGLLYEVLSLAGWVAAFFVARWGADVVGGWLPMGEASDAMRYGVGFALLFIATAFLDGMVAWLARRGVKALGVRPVDRLFGAVFGLARGLALLLVAAVLVSLTPARQATWWTESTGARWLDQALLELHPWLPLPGGKEQSV